MFLFFSFTALIFVIGFGFFITTETEWKHLIDRMVLFFSLIAIIFVICFALFIFTFAERGDTGQAGFVVILYCRRCGFADCLQRPDKFVKVVPYKDLQLFLVGKNGIVIPALYRILIKFESVTIR